jgi:hypothetical protein
MHPTKFVYEHYRSGAGAEAAPAGPGGDLTWQLRPGKMDSKGEYPANETYDALLLLSTVSGNFEIGYWRYSLAGETPAWVVFSTVALVANTPLTVPFPYEGAQIYVRSLGAIAAFTLFCQPKFAAVATVAASSAIIAGATHLEDDPMANGDRGVFSLGVRNDTPTSATTSLNGDYSQVSVDSAGVAWVRPTPLAQSWPFYAEDVAAASADLGTFIMGVRNDTPTAAKTTLDGDYIQISTDLAGAVWIRPTTVAGAWPFYAEDTIAADGDKGALVLAVRRDVMTSGVSADGDYVTLNVDSDGCLRATLKSYDSSTQANREFPIVSDRSYRQTDPISAIAAAQNITNAWADLGPEFTTDGANTIALWVNVDINTCVNVRFRALAKHTSAGATEFLIPTKIVNSTATPWLTQVEQFQYEWNIDGTDFLIVLPWDLQNCIKYVQFQVMAESIPGAVGQVLTAEVTYGW